MQSPSNAPLRDPIRVEAEVLLGWMERLDDVMGTVMPTGNSIEIAGPAQAEVTETFFLARRTFGSVFVLMDWTIRTTDTDRTEDADILVRRLLELYARVAFIVMFTDHPDERDLRAAQVVLTDVRKHMRLLGAGLDVSSEAEHEEAIDVWRQARDHLEAEIVCISGEALGMSNTLDILQRISPKHVLYWRHSSDIAHGGIMGRAYQREELTFGVPATPFRQDSVMHTAIAVMAEICAMWLDAMVTSSVDYDSFAEGFRSFTESASMSSTPGEWDSGHYSRLS